MSKNNNSYNRQKLQQERLMKKLENEIKEIEKEINNVKLTNFKIKTVRNLKIGLRAIQLFAPYIVTACIVFDIFSLMGTTPFIRDNEKQKLKVKKEFDSFGNIRYEQQYESFDNSLNKVYYIGKWNKKDDGFYSREIKTYVIDDNIKDIVTKIVDDCNITSLEDVFDKPNSVKIQIQNNLTDEEISKEAYLEAAIYSTSSDDFIIVKESLANNLYVTFLWFIVTIFTELIPLNIRSKCSSFSFEDCFNNLVDRYQPQDTQSLIKKLEIKKENYNRLMR